MAMTTISDKLVLVFPGLMLSSWSTDGSVAALILVNWECCTLEVIRSPTGALDLFGESDRIGGEIDLKPGEPLDLRVLIDKSCIEVFCGSGEVLSTRVYRGIPPKGADAGVDFVAYGGSARLARVMAFEMTSIWKSDVQAQVRSVADWADDGPFPKA